VLRIKMIDFFD